MKNIDLIKKIWLTTLVVALSIFTNCALANEFGFSVQNLSSHVLTLNSKWKTDGCDYNSDAQPGDIQPGEMKRIIIHGNGDCSWSGVQYKVSDGSATWLDKVNANHEGLYITFNDGTKDAKTFGCAEWDGPYSKCRVNP